MAVPVNLTTNRPEPGAVVPAAGAEDIKLDRFTDPATTTAPRILSENQESPQITEIESPRIPRSLDDVDSAVIGNGNYALEAGLVPARRRPIRGWKAPSITPTPISR